VSDRAMAYTESSRLLSDGADAVKRLLSAHKEVLELSGHVDRVHELDRALNDAQHTASDRAATRMAGQSAVFFENVALSTPLGDRLTRPFSFRVEPGQHTVVSGPNGCGKSTLLRVLAGLRDGDGADGVVGVADDAMFLPQRPYVAAAGPLRDQVTYPTLSSDPAAGAWRDEDLLAVLNAVGLAEVIQREGGLSAVRDWSDVLSGGERQQVRTKSWVLSACFLRCGYHPVLISLSLFFTCCSVSLSFLRRPILTH
jgi:ABC-type uncharacterized transport system fused permease/ATPase subunit